MTKERRESVPELSLAERDFFEAKPAALPLYEALRARLLQELPQTEIRVARTQISFYDRHMFAAVSFLPARRKKERPEPYITLTLGLPRPLASPRVAATAEPRPGRFTHHLLRGSAAEIAAELTDWLREAAAWAGR